MALYTRDCSDRILFARSRVVRFWSRRLVGNDELGSRFFAIDERCPAAVALFHPLAIFFQEERIVIVPRSAVYFRIVSALPLHDETLRRATTTIYSLRVLKMVVLASASAKAVADV